MAKRTIVTETVETVRSVATAALDAAAEEARRVIAETVAGTAVRLEARAKAALPAVEGAVKTRLVKPVDRALGAPARRTTAKTAAPATKKTAKAARPAAKAATRNTAARRSAARKRRV